MYYTHFIGHPIHRPTLIGSKDFKGIGIIDTDPYIPDGYVLPISFKRTMLMLFSQGRNELVSRDTFYRVRVRFVLNAARYVNQNQFFRRIDNFIFDLTQMPPDTTDPKIPVDEPLRPTGIHWQVAQAAQLQNLKFVMPVAKKDDKNATHHGIFQENGSGGFVSGEFISTPSPLLLTPLLVTVANWR